MLAPRRAPWLLCLVTSSALGCGGSGSAAEPPSTVEVRCPSPIGAIIRESCGDIADDFGALTVGGALQRAGTGRDAEARVEAIRDTQALANGLKERRVELCEGFNACKVTKADHASGDRTLAERMAALIRLWDGRSFASGEGVSRYRLELSKLRAALGNGVAPLPPSTTAHGSVAPATASAAVVVGPEKLVRVEGSGVTFPEPGAAAFAGQDDKARDVLRAPAAALGVEPGKRYQIKVRGTYSPAEPPLVAPGDELLARLHYRTRKPVDLYVALRSLEDPEAADATTTWSLPAGEKGARNAALRAAPGSSGFYLAVGASSAAAFDLDDVELLRQGVVLVAARAEAGGEPRVGTRCAATANPPISGKASFRCETTAGGDVLTLGLPTSYLALTMRGASGEHGEVRTLSLDGGRSIDVAVTERADLVVRLVGPGTVVVRAVEVRRIP